MTFEEIDRAMAQVKDNLVVQGELLHRLGTAMDASRRDFDERIGALLNVVAEDREQLRAMRAAMAQLFEHMDRFIRGLESDGHKKAEE